ncbi:MAG: ferredoxin--NADP reductase [Terriglobia bacterium]
MAISFDKFQRIEIIERRDYCGDLWSIRVRPEEKLAFKAGQYATLGVESGGRIRQRAYSIVSSPLEDDIEFFFELVPDGELTPLLFKLGVGDTFWMRRQARGLFLLDGASGHPKHLLLATVTGVAPYVSMVRSIAWGAAENAGSSREIVIIQAASRSWEFAYRQELEGLCGSCQWLHYVPSVSRPWEDPEWKGEVGRIEDLARKYIDALAFEPSNTTAYLCGHPQMIENCKGTLRRRGFTKEHIREEIYWVPAKTPTAVTTSPA